MDIVVRPITQDEEPEWHESLGRSFGHHARPEELEAWRLPFERPRALGAFDGSSIVGACGGLTMRLTVPGAELPMVGVTAVGVSPTHRRRGILTSLMRRQLDDLREGGEPLATLWASEAAIYGRFGYGLATLTASMEIESARVRFQREVEDTGRIRLVEKDEALAAMPPIYERLRATRAGTVSRGRELWQENFADVEEWRDGASAYFYALHESAGGPDGYVIYRVKRDWSEAEPKGTVRVRELVADTLEATASLWRYCFGIDLTTTVQAWERPVDDPLLWMVVEPRRIGFRLSDGLFVRLVDLPAAIAGRRYGAEDRLVLDVRDAFCPWNEGRHELTGGPDGASCEPTERDPDLTLATHDLAAAYLGGVGFRTLARAGRVVEETDGALARADAMFGADPAPWCPFVF